jgi:hypothetical protein
MNGMDSYRGDYGKMSLLTLALMEDSGWCGACPGLPASARLPLPACLPAPPRPCPPFLESWGIAGAGAALADGWPQQAGQQLHAPGP